MTLNTLNSVILSDLKSVEDKRGALVPIEGGKEIPFEIKRIFYIYGVQKGTERGHHAHKVCNQIFICLKGQVRVSCDDGKKKKSFLLDSPKKALLIPSSLWAVEDYLSEDSLLLILTDQAYDSQDYIREYDHFLKFRSGEEN